MADNTSWLEQRSAETEQRLSRISAIHAELGQVHSTGRSPDNLVAATVSGHGKLTSVEIADQAIRKGDAGAIGRAVVAAVTAAFDAAQATGRERISEVVDLSAYDAVLAEIGNPGHDDAPPVIGY
ncbi:MAG: YbaB/EbfC family nucleoid-associated protein [Pseudonocardiales bacterium]